MTIQEAKQEIINTVKVYTSRDENDVLTIPIERQRPILMMGPPGIGKTAIMEQIAHELNINLVSYTITHHTRQSTIGLPFITKKMWGEKEVSITEYTMSEIIAGIYEAIENSGLENGILFLDEINCVSETLIPTMLQFLQYKTFGSHRLPEGFIIVTAGNPPEYNSSVRDFDIVTLDRIRKIDIDVDFGSFKRYALGSGLHGSILAYLEIRKDHFYSIKTDSEGKHFVTARGWDDLSRILLAREALQIEIDENLVIQYLQDKEIAESFSSYFKLWNKYKDLYRIDSILDGHAPKSEEKELIKKAAFDEKLSLIIMLTEALSKYFREYDKQLEIQGYLHSLLLGAKESSDIQGFISEKISEIKADISRRKSIHLISSNEEKLLKRIISDLKNLNDILLSQNNDFDSAKRWFVKKEENRQAEINNVSSKLTNAFAFLDAAFGQGQEIVLFLSELSASTAAVKFINDCGNEAYYKYNKLLLLNEQRQDVLSELSAMEL